MTTIYLSSTYEDLKDHRQAVFHALRKSGYQVTAMEDYVARDERPVDKCLQDVARSNIYVGLFAFRYGYIPPPKHNNPDGLSITELEFRCADQNPKTHCLTFIADKKTSWPAEFFDAVTGDGNKGENIDRLRKYLLAEKLAPSFSEPYKLASLVQSAVTKQVEESHPQATDRDQPSPTITWDIQKQGSPYPGLMHFTRKYARVFFGREAEMREILDRLHTPEGRFLIISGDSGVGKSSVVDAGVLPRLQEVGLPGGQTCLGERMLPSQGEHPFDALIRLLHPYATRAGLKPDAIGEELKATPAKLAAHIRNIISQGSDRDTLVLFLDQMEELFTAHDPEHANSFLTALYQAVQEGALWVIATIRGDHLHHCHGHPEMLQVLRGPGHYPLGRAEPFMMHDVIVKPAQCAGLTISDKLARRLIHDAGSEPGNLPLLAFVLDRLFEGKQDNTLSETVYAGFGGIGGAIADHAKAVEKKVHNELGDKALQRLPEVFHSLVIVNPEGLPTRRRPLIAEFSADLRPLVNMLVSERLLSTEGEGENSTVCVGHEKLFEMWPALRDYVGANKKRLMDQTLLENRARKWGEMGMPWFGGLAAGRELQDFGRAGVPTARAKQYLKASRRARWIRSGAAASALALIVVFGTWLWQEGLTMRHVGMMVWSTFFAVHQEPQMEVIKQGRFQMGDSAGESTQRPVHPVKVAKFAIGRHEVTFDEYDRFLLATGRELPGDQGWGRGRRPVINVSWDDARDYAKWLSEQTGKRYRLPTEAEWEYAARAGTTTAYWWGNDVGKNRANCLECGSQWAGKLTGPVGSFELNAFGLHDTAGNVWEWVEDCVHNDYNNAPDDGRAWGEENGGDCGRRVIRGGSWFDDPVFLRSSYRFWNDPDSRFSNIGFRLAQDIE